MKLIVGEKVKPKGRKDTVLAKHLKVLAFGEIIIDLLLIILGIVYCSNPEISINLTCKTIGLLISVSSIYAIIKYLFDENLIYYKYDLIYGVISLILGILVFTKPLDSSYIFIIGLAVWLIITSIRKLLVCRILYKYKDDSFAYVLTISLLTLLLGILAIFNPFKASIAFTSLCGLCLIFYGAMNVSHMIMLIQYAKKFIKYLKQ